MSRPVETPLKVPAAASYGPALALLATVFFMWGFVTVLNDILAPHLKAVFHLDYAHSMLVQFLFFLAYFFVSSPAAAIIARIGYKRSIVLGLVVAAAGALGFIPAAILPSFPLFLVALFVLASGITVLQVAANPYVSALGPEATASSRLNLVQALNSLGTFVGPYVGGLLIFTANDNCAAQAATALGDASSVELPYLGIALLLLSLAAIIARSRLPTLPQIEDPSHADLGGGDSLWRHPALILGAIGIFVYVGAEVSIGSFMVNYLALPQIGNLSCTAAARHVSYYWGGAMIGRFIGSAVLQALPTGRVLAVCALAASLLVAVSMVSVGALAMWSLILVGLCNSIMFPSIFTLGIAGLGRLTGRGSRVLVMAIVGGAIIPMATGRLADSIGLHHAFVLPALCYLYIIYYGACGHRRLARAPS